MHFGEAFAGSLHDNDLLFGMLMLCVDTVLYALIGYLYGRWVSDEYRFVEVPVADMPEVVGAQLRNVTLRYGSDDAEPQGNNQPQQRPPALQNVTIEFRRDRITCLLGRNGAGKSTIIKLLTGQLEPTAGAVFLPQNVHPITGDERKERVGLCPQSTVLIPNLTAKEHLQLYASIKLQSGGDGARAAATAAEENCEVERVMAGLEFGEFERFRCENLSGGFKRRLNIGIAFIGSPNLVILDEPCSAVDTKARKAIWHTIQALRKGRAVIMATHHLDEAELLSDSVAILNDGRLIGEHTTHALHEQFMRTLGLRVHLRVGRNRSAVDEEVQRELRAALGEGEAAAQVVVVQTDADVIEVTVLRHGADGKVDVNVAPLVRLLEGMETAGRIAGFKVTSNNLEGMFNRLVCSSGNGTENGSAHKTSAGVENAGNQKAADAEAAAEKSVEVTQWMIVRALFWKRFVHFRRNYRLIICMLVLPTVFVAIAMAFMNIRPPGEFDMALDLSKDLYAGSQEFYSLENNSTFDGQIYEQLMIGSNGSSATTTAPANTINFGTSEEAFRWMIDCAPPGATNRYGGISLNGSVAAVWYNNKGYHSMPAYLNELNNAMFNAEMRSPAQEYHIRTVNRPLKLGLDELSASSV